MGLLSWLSGSKKIQNERRRIPRAVGTSVMIEIEGAALQVDNWSPSGFVCKGYTGGADSGARIDVALCYPGRDGREKLALPAVVVRHDPQRGALAAKFCDMTAENSTTLVQLFRGNIDINSFA